jgi:hypothetical protein
MKIRISILILFLGICNFGFSQQKYEKETRIKDSDIPASALEFVNSLDLDSKIKWYKEEGLKTSSFEAKTKFNGQKLSIEFSKDGQFEDLEIEIEESDINSQARSIIQSKFKNEHNRYSVEKVQTQYSGSREDIYKLLHEKNVNPNLIINYEIILTTKKEGEYVMFEYLFDSEGMFIRKSQVLLKMTDNIEF